MQLTEPAVGQLALLEAGRDHAGDLAAGRQGGIGQRAHRPDVGAAVDQPDLVLGQPAAERGSPLEVDLWHGGRGAEKDADAVEHGR